jgi:uridine kinase
MVALSIETLHFSDFGREDMPDGSEYDCDALSRRIRELQVSRAVDVLLVEGAYTLSNASIRDMATIKVWLDCDADTRLSRLVVRDTRRGISLDRILQEYIDRSKPAFEESILPTRGLADVILPNGQAASMLLAEAIWDTLTKVVEVPKTQKTLLQDPSQQYYEAL